MTEVKYKFGGMDASVGISTPCPSCGAKTLFIGEGGHLSCSGTKCMEPSVEAAIANAIKEAEEHGGNEALRDLASAVNKLGLAKEIFDAMTAAMELAVADGRIEGEAGR